MQLTNDADQALCFTERFYRGDVIYRTGVKNISDIRDPDVGGMPKFNNEIRSIRVSPFRVKVKYHFMWDDADLPGPHSGLAGIGALVTQIKDMHAEVSQIWSKYLIQLEMDPIIGQYESEKYFELDIGRADELTKLRGDSPFRLSNACVNVVLVESIIKDAARGAIGVATRGALDVPVAVAEVKAPTNVFENARTIAHEIGHLFGLSHGANERGRRLMTQTGAIDGDREEAVRLSQNEVEIVHRTLAANDTSRSLLRIE